jgi:DNA-binding protein H-NS
MRIDHLNLKDLNALSAKIEAAILTRKEAERENIRRAIEKTCAESGFTVKDILGKGKGSRKGSKVAVKYRNGKGDTWSGRGRHPRWLAAEMKAGKKLDSFAV